VRAAAMRRSLASSGRSTVANRHRVAEASCHRHKLHNEHCAVWHLVIRAGCRHESVNSDFALTSRSETGNHHASERPEGSYAAFSAPPVIITKSTSFTDLYIFAGAVLGVRGALRTGSG
jgi:hypothetical protein